jgi:hypothetical protein
LNALLEAKLSAYGNITGMGGESKSASANYHSGSGGRAGGAADVMSMGGGYDEEDDDERQYK